MSQETSPIQAPRKKICCTCLREYDENQHFCLVDMSLLTPLYFDNPELGSVLGNCIKVKSLIAEGRVARVLLCESEGNRLHALRLLKRVEQRYVSTFLQEAQDLASLDSPRIVRLHAAGMLGREPYMMLEYLPGGNLAAWLKKDEKLPFADVARIVAQVCEGLLYLHSKQITYPVLKPEHVMFLDETRSQCCLIDLGKTFFAHDNRNVSVGGAIFLNPHYSAPEVLMGREPGLASSAYSVACLVHRCLTGQNLFGGQTDLQLASKHMSEKPPMIDWPKLGVPDDFQAVVMRALAKSADQRTSVEEFGAVAGKYAS